MSWFLRLLLGSKAPKKVIRNEDLEALLALPPATPRPVSCLIEQAFLMRRNGRPDIGAELLRIARDELTYIEKAWTEQAAKQPPK